MPPASSPRPYGRTEAVWRKLAHEGLRFLRERARLGKRTSYTEMNTVLQRRTGLPGFDFELKHDRAAMRYLLGLILDLDRPTSGHKITAIVNYLDLNEPGPGFYRIAQEYGVLPKNASAEAKLEFWINEMNAVYAHYQRRTGPDGEPR